MVMQEQLSSIYKAGMKSTVFCPDDTPDINVREIERLEQYVYGQWVNK